MDRCASEQHFGLGGSARQIPGRRLDGDARQIDRRGLKWPSFSRTRRASAISPPTQPFHSLAASIYRAARNQNRKVVTTNYVLAELVALLTSPLRFSRASIVA